MQVLFVIRHRGYVRLYESMLLELARRGHRVHLAFERDDTRVTSSSEHELTDRLSEQQAEITHGEAPVREDGWVALSSSLRRAIDYLRYLTPVYENAPKLRARGARDAPRLVVSITRLPGLRSPRAVALLDRVLRAMERAIPRSAAIDTFLRDHRPDLLLVTPLIAEPEQEDYLRSAKAQGIRNALCVASWDNLTNKGLIRDVPDRIYVWNEDQRREAIDLHEVPGNRVVATGANPFDQWFAWQPSTEEAEFRERVGLPAEGAILLYLCSSNFIAPEEPRFVEDWVRRVRAHPDPRLSEAAILVRPHPKSGRKWRGNDLSRHEGVVVWPPTGAVAGDADTKSGFFDSMYHAAAVVGLNTSAIIESTIVGRPAFTVVVPEFAGTQEGTLHFHYLMADNGGPLTVARSFEEHLDHLAGTLMGGGDGGRVGEGFLRRFVRPHGLDSPATPVLVDALERQAAEPEPAPVEAVGRPVALTTALRPLAAVDTWWEGKAAALARTRKQSAKRRARLLRQAGAHARRLRRRAPAALRRVPSRAGEAGGTDNGGDPAQRTASDRAPRT